MVFPTIFSRQTSTQAILPPIYTYKLLNALGGALRLEGRNCLMNNFPYESTNILELLATLRPPLGGQPSFPLCYFCGERGGLEEPIEFIPAPPILPQPAASVPIASFRHYSRKSQGRTGQPVHKRRKWADPELEGERKRKTKGFSGEILAEGTRKPWGAYVGKISWIWRHVSRGV